MEQIKIDKKAILDLVRIKEEFNSIIESLELMSNPEFMESYRKSKKEIENGNLVDFNDL